MTRRTVFRRLSPSGPPLEIFLVDTRITRQLKGDTSSISHHFWYVKNFRSSNSIKHEKFFFFWGGRDSIFFLVCPGFLKVCDPMGSFLGIFKGGLNCWDAVIGPRSWVFHVVFFNEWLLIMASQPTPLYHRFPSIRLNQALSNPYFCWGVR